MDFPVALKERRAARRLSQLELALLAGTTQRHLSFIESGRSVPGREMVVRLTESLGLPLRERNELLLAAGYAPAYPQTSLDDPALAPVRARCGTSSTRTGRTRPSSSTGAAPWSPPTTGSRYWPRAPPLS